MSDTSASGDSELIDSNSLMEESDSSDERCDSGIADDATSRASGSCSDSIVEPATPQQLTLMIRLSETKCRLTLLYEDGTIKPFSNEDIPLCLGLIRRRAFVFGSDVFPYVQPRQGTSKFGKYKVAKWDLGCLLLESGNHAIMFNYNGNVTHVRVELLFALFLNNLKTLVEEKLENYGTIFHIKHVIFSVPMWFTSQHRQRIKDSSEIAGFDKVSVVNDISSLAWFHASNTQPNLGKPFNLMVFSENSGNVDLAVYRGVTGVFLTMVAITGNRYLSAEDKKHNGYAYLRDLVKLKYEEVLRATDHKSQTEEEKKARKMKFRGYLIRSLLGELSQKLDGMMDLACLECLVISEEPKWGVIFQSELIQKYFKSVVHFFKPEQFQVSPPRWTIEEEKTNGKKTKAMTSKDVEVCNSDDLNNNEELQNYNENNNNAVKKNLKMIWSSPPSFVEDLTSGFVISDLIPFELCRNSIGYGESFPKLCEVDAVASSGTFGKFLKHDSSNRSMIFQRGVKDCYEVGTLEALSESFYQDQNSKLEIKIRLCKDSVIEMTDMHICSNDGKQKLKLECSVLDHCWVSGKLSENSKENFRVELKKMIKCSEEYHATVSDLREQLWTLCQEIADALWSRNFKRSLGQRRRVEMQKSVDEVSAMLRHVTTGPLLEVGREDLQNNLKKLKGYRRYLAL